MRDRVSFSEWRLYNEGCKWRWKIEYLDGNRTKDKGIYLDFGTCVHGAIEKYKTRKNPVELHEASSHFETEMRRLHAENVDGYKDREKALRLDDFVAAGKKILQHLDKCDELVKAEVVYNEHELNMPIERSDDLKINFKGFIDMVIKTKDKKDNTILYVIDFKTCSWGWDAEKRSDKKLQYQLFFYKHFLCKKFNLDPKNVKTAFVLLKRTPRSETTAVEFFPVSAGPASVQRALDDFNSDITDMKERSERNNDFPKDRTKCKDVFGGTCPHFGTNRCE